MSDFSFIHWWPKLTHREDPLGIGNNQSCTFLHQKGLQGLSNDDSISGAARLPPELSSNFIMFV